MDGVHEMRDRVGADLVHLVVGDSDVGGIAYLSAAFSLGQRCCFAHEFGHNMGLAQGELAQLALERHEVGDHLDGLDRRGWRLAQRASWFRLLPMRATCRMHSRSMSAAAAVYVRVRAIACRSRSDSGTPTAAAFARQSANSAGDTRACTLTVRRSRIGAPSGRACAEPASRAPAPRSGGRAERGPLTAVSTRSCCWPDDARGGHGEDAPAGPS